MAIKKKKKDIGKRYPKDKPAEYYQPSTGQPVSVEKAKELAEPRTYTFGSAQDLTREQFETAKSITDVEAYKRAQPLITPEIEGAIETRTRIAEGKPSLEEEEKINYLAEQVGKVQLTGDIEKDKLSYAQAIKSALASTSAGVAGGAVVGAAGGAAAAGIGAVPGAIGGAALGGLSGFISGFRSNLKTQRADMLKGEASNLLKQEQNLLKLVSNTNQGGDAMKNLDYFNEQLSLIGENYERLKLESMDKPSFWLGEDAKRQMEKFEVFYTEGGMRDILTMQMQQAILNPNPNKVLMGIESIQEDEESE